MSQMTYEEALRRIKSSGTELAVFRIPGMPQHFNVVFRSTVRTNTLIRQGDSDYLGTFTKKTAGEAEKCMKSAMLAG